MKYLVAWGRISDPRVWESYEYTLGLGEEVSSFTVNDLTKKNSSIIHVNIADWLNHYAEIGFRIKEKIVNNDKIIIVLSR